MKKITVLFLITLSICGIVTSCHEPAIDASTAMGTLVAPKTTPGSRYDISGGLKNEEYIALKDATFEFKVRGRYLANSKNWSGLGGHYADDNMPTDINHEIPDGAGLELIALPNIRISHERHKGMKLYLVNRTGNKIEFAACDSNLSITQQAKLNNSKEFKDIEYTPSSWCGNSYHNIVLPNETCWAFTAFRYSGPQKATLRFAMKLGNKTLYSNTFKGSIYNKMFTVKQGHKATNIMDPYNE